MKIIVDADSICYYAAFATNKDDKTVDDCYEVIDMVYANIIEDMPNNCNDIESYVGGEGNFRFNIYPEYKANRKDLEKPKYLKQAYAYLVHFWNGTVVNGVEADDMVAIRATELGDDCVIVGIDKDLRQIAGTHYNWKKREFETITPEQADYNFWMQMLTGDTSDNIKGVKGIGPKKAEKLLGEFSSLNLYYHSAVEEVYGDKELFEQTYKCLRLLRSRDELAKFSAKDEPEHGV